MTIEILVEYLLSENWPSFIYEPWDLRHALAVTSVSFAFIPYARKRAFHATPKFRRKAFASKFSVSPDAIQQFESQYRVLPLEQAFLNYEKQQAAWSVWLHARELRNTPMGGPVFLSKAEIEPWGCRNIAELKILPGSQKRRLGWIKQQPVRGTGNCSSEIWARWKSSNFISLSLVQIGNRTHLSSLTGTQQLPLGQHGRVMIGGIFRIINPTI